MNAKEMELLDGFLNKGWGCDLDEIYSIITKLLDSYNQEKEKNKKLEEVIDMIAEDIFESGADIICKKMKESGNCFAKNYGSPSCWSESCLKDCMREYYLIK